MRFWISSAKSELGIAGRAEDELIPEADVQEIAEGPTQEQYEEDLPKAPFAIRLPGKILMVNELR